MRETDLLRQNRYDYIINMPRIIDLRFSQV